MEMFYATFGFVGAVVLGIVILAVFFKLVSLLQAKMGAPAIIKMRGFLKDAAWINVHLTGGKLLERVRFVGFTVISFDPWLPSRGISRFRSCFGLMFGPSCPSCREARRPCSHIGDFHPISWYQREKIEKGRK